MVFLSYHHWFQRFFNVHGPLVKRWNDFNESLGSVLRVWLISPFAPNKTFNRQAFSSTPSRWNFGTLLQTVFVKHATWSLGTKPKQWALCYTLPWILYHKSGPSAFTIPSILCHEYFAVNTSTCHKVLWYLSTCHGYLPWVHRYLPWKDSNSIYAECHAVESSYEKVVLQCASFQICNNHFW